MISKTLSVLLLSTVAIKVTYLNRPHRSLSIITSAIKKFFLRTELIVCDAGLTSVFPANPVVAINVF